MQVQMLLPIVLCSYLLGCSNPERGCASVKSWEYDWSESQNPAKTQAGHIAIKSATKGNRNCSVYVEGLDMWSIRIYTANHCLANYSLIDAEMTLYLAGQEPIKLPELKVQKIAQSIITELRKTEHPTPEMLEKALVSFGSKFHEYLMKQNSSNCYADRGGELAVFSLKSLCTTVEDLTSFVVPMNNGLTRVTETALRKTMRKMEEVRDSMPYVQFKMIVDQCRNIASNGRKVPTVCPFYHEIENKFPLPPEIITSIDDYIGKHYMPLFEEYLKGVGEPAFIPALTKFDGVEDVSYYPIDALLSLKKKFYSSTSWNVKDEFKPGDSGSVILNERYEPIMTISTLGNNELSEGFALSPIPSPKQRKSKRDQPEPPDCK